MSDSYSLLPLNDEVREWLASEGISDVPNVDGRNPTFPELKKVLDTSSVLNVSWEAGDPPFSAEITKFATNLTTSLLVDGETENGCNFHFRGGNLEVIEMVASALAREYGPVVVYAHSGSCTKVILGS